jgi:SAM-dependent methyltransferase
MIIDQETFVLDDSQELDLCKLIDIKRWIEFGHAQERFRGLVIVAGEVLKSPWLKAPQEPWLSLAYLRGLPKISDDGLDFSIDIEFKHRVPALQLIKSVLNNEMPKGGYSTLESALPICPGEIFRIVVTVGAGPKGNSEADWFGITLFSIGDYSGVSHRRAQTNSHWRLSNEIAHFNTVYSSNFYKNRQVVRGSQIKTEVRLLPDLVRQSELPISKLCEKISEIFPQPEENVYGFAHRMLGSVLPIKPQNFAERLQRMHSKLSDRPVRMLSLCAGEAAVEGSILEAAKVPVDLCLLDVNESLLDKAASRIPDFVKLDRVIGNANQLSGQLGHFDIINITSGLHHLVDLESVLSGIANSLASNGEFWLIGEQVGRNGNRLWPKAREECNKLFSNWPARYRKNSSTKQTDDFIPDLDYSTTSFEGIRSEEILSLIDHYFLVSEVYLRNCFLWRLFNSAYSTNFDLNNLDDIVRIREAVSSELLCWANGGIGTELFGVYRSKKAETFSCL